MADRDTVTAASRQPNSISGGVHTAIGLGGGGRWGAVQVAMLERMDSFADAWRGMRMGVTARTMVWSFSVSDLPSGRPGLEQWLYDRWADMHAWVEEAGGPVVQEGSGWRGVR